MGKDPRSSRELWGGQERERHTHDPRNKNSFQTCANPIVKKKKKKCRHSRPQSRCARVLSLFFSRFFFLCLFFYFISFSVFFFLLLPLFLSFLFCSYFYFIFLSPVFFLFYFIFYYFPFLLFHFPFHLVACFPFFSFPRYVFLPNYFLFFPYVFQK